MGVGREVYRVFVGKPEGKKPFGTSRHRWEDEIRMDLREVGCVGVEWIHLAGDRDQWWALWNMKTNPRVLVPRI
jgi:hypothetical protein